VDLDTNCVSIESTPCTISSQDRQVESVTEGETGSVPERRAERPSARVELGGASRVQLGERLDTVSARRPPTLRDPGDKRLIETGQPGQPLGLVDRRQEGVGIEHRLLNDRSPGLVQEVGQHGAGVDNGQQLTVVDPKPVRQASQPAISAQPVRLGLGFSSALRDQLVHQAPPLGQMSQRPPTGPGTLGPVTIRCRWLGHVDQLTHLRRHPRRGPACQNLGR